MPKELISVGVGILTAIIPLLLPDLSRFFAYGLFSAAAILILLGAYGFLRSNRDTYAKTGNITIFNVTLRK
ncbi:MAG TPA: hypothetical protein VMT98_06170 [Verrucomicrobiae bacterium]|jgi:hypothetical protein|nr:hypothetical protein [Verrucomicrobiae bacterium]